VGKQALGHGDYKGAQTFFAQALKDNPENVDALFLGGNAALGLKQYDEAAHMYEAAIAKRPPMWNAHKNLVIIDAMEGKWAEFDAQRKLLQEARARGDQGLSAQDSDVIDVFYVGPERYVVRESATLSGQFKTRYNFLHFGKDDKLDFRIACESDDADQITFAKAHPAEAAAGKRSFSLDSYSASATADGKFSQTHGTLKFYPDGEPTYEMVRADVLKALEARGKSLGPTTIINADKPPM